MRVGSTDVPLDSVVAAFHQGYSPEMVRAQYPPLTLEEVYGAIAYYLADRKDVDGYLDRQDALWARGRAQSDASPAPVVRRLKAHGKAAARGTPA
jgi:predicted acetyltransferase